MALESTKPAQTKPGAIELIAGVLSLLWLIGAAVFFWTMPTQEGPRDPLRAVVVMLAVFLPVAMIWVAAAAARAARIMRAEARRLHLAIDGMRAVVLADRKERLDSTGASPEVEKTLKQLVEKAHRTETALATFTSTRAPRAPAMPAALAPPAEEQPALALGVQPDDTPPDLSHSDLIRALNFPDSAEDRDGFAALRKALRHHQVAQLVQASQDVLTLLSQDGIYMDDLRPDLARPEYWRRFAKGERGGAVAPLGGVRDRSSLALTAGRMREDAIFRDAAHHFLRRFDTMLERIEPEASDEDLTALAQTRTARAFMLLGRVSGAFD